MLINPAHIKVSEILNQGTVLVTDPTDNYRNTLKRFLTNFNVRSLKLCDSLANAKTEMTISHLSLLIVEWKLNGTQNGLQFCCELRGDKRYWEVPIFLNFINSVFEQQIEPMGNVHFFKGQNFRPFNTSLPLVQTISAPTHGPEV